MFQQYIRQCSQEVHKSLNVAIAELASAHQNVLTPEHLLLGLISLPDSEAVQMLQQVLDNPQQALRDLTQDIYLSLEQLPLQQQANQVVASPEVEEVFRIALKEAKKLGDAFTGTGALLLGLCHERAGAVAIHLSNHGIKAEPLRKVLIQLRNGKTLDAQDAEGRKDPLDEYTQDLTKMARSGELDPVIGREDEIARVIQTLSRRKKNNPVLIGEPGVGKTVIVEGLAQRIAEARVPDILRGKRVLSLDLAEIIAGASMRGEFEERIKGVRDAVIASQGQIILFIDELHTVVGAGAGAGGLDAPALLKSALAQGALQVIGADTLEEYHRYVEADKALERRFQPIMVREPSVEETIAILEGLAPKFESHHDIHYRPQALEAAARLSERYITDRHLPDKAVDLMDEAGADRRLHLLALSRPMQELERQRQSLLADKQDAFNAQEFERVAALQTQIINLEQQLDAERNQLLNDRSAEDRWVTAEDIARVVSRLTGIPVARLAESESDKLSHMEDKLHQRIVGQQDAVSAVANAIRRNRTGIDRGHRPIGSFLFLGPTGVGKTELAKALAEFMLDDESKIIRLDMSEYMERHEVSKMIGAPPGYVGYGEGGQLTEKVRRNPYSIILLDELEKAHPDVFNILLQILEDGRLTDAQGRTVSFRNTLLIGTSNLGSEALITDRPPVGFIFSKDPDYETARHSVMQEVKKFFKPEFLNRLDDIIVFHYLTREDVQQIARLLLKSLCQQMQAIGIRLVIAEAVIAKLAKDGFEPAYGARPLRREIERQLENPIAAMIVGNQCGPGSVIYIELPAEDQPISLRVAAETQAPKQAPAG
ncbi:AAA family ATPase [Shewanella salipaludis]|uniref:ATP-dependent Clp protease ATP-binding subunit n=1 Tax=Shewanella salipaludis TaxID=2723052 RepID=A0A972FYP9_9GAMM|nr:ATP-dependent Clp protease ATP-binding subunit [Shewanella salipaludis]